MDSENQGLSLPFELSFDQPVFVPISEVDGEPNFDWHDPLLRVQTHWNALPDPGARWDAYGGFTTRINRITARPMPKVTCRWGWISLWKKPWRIYFPPSSTKLLKALSRKALPRQFLKDSPAIKFKWRRVSFTTKEKYKSYLSGWSNFSRWCKRSSKPMWVRESLRMYTDVKGNES